MSPGFSSQHIECSSFLLMIEMLKEYFSASIPDKGFLSFGLTRVVFSNSTLHDYKSVSFVVIAKCKSVKTITGCNENGQSKISCSCKPLVKINI